jgi:hypothetical protein
MPEPKKVKLICPECDKEVELVDGEGVCDCGLDVGWVVEKRRRDRAVKKLAEREEAEVHPPKTKKRFAF